MTRGGLRQNMTTNLRIYRQQIQKQLITHSTAKHTIQSFNMNMRLLIKLSLMKMQGNRKSLEGHTKLSTLKSI